MLDLHVHSTFSDGTDSPEEIASAAKSLHLRAIALTDHDNAYGVGAFLDACRANGVTGIAGVELSAAVDSGTLHILGLGIDPGDEGLNDAFQSILDSREERNQRILEALRGLGFDLTWEEVSELAGSGVVGRLHFAEAMIARGWAEDSNDAFSRFLEKGAPAYVDRFRFSPEECVDIIRRAGGVPVIAHPTSWIDDDAELESELRALKDAGLMGIEAYHPSHSPETTLELLRIAKHLELFATGGSDYHGEAGKPGIRLGVGDGSLLVPDKLLAPLLPHFSPKGVVQ